MALIQMETYSAALHTTTKIRVILPTPLVREYGKDGCPFYDEPRRFPVLYLLHGTYGNSGDYIRYSRIESYAEKYYLAVVMPDADNMCYRNLPHGGPRYFDYYTDELPKLMKWTFPISGEPEDTFICGLSMGANGALKAALTYPERYGYAAMMSTVAGGWQKAVDADCVWAPAFLPGEDLTGTDEDLFALTARASEAAKAGTGKLPSLYFCIGQQDSFYPDNLDLKRHMEELGIPFTWHQQPGAHDFDFWDDELKRILEWLPIEKRDPVKRWYTE